MSCLFSLADSVKAQDHANNVKKELVNPGNLFYPVKRFWEKNRIKIIKDDYKKIKYYELLLDKRYSELNFIVMKKDVSQMQKSSERFQYYAGLTTETLETLQNADENKAEMIKRFENYIETLPALRDNFPANSSNWMFVQYCIDSLNIYISDLKN